MLTSTAHTLFIEWGVGPLPAWEALELDDVGLDGIQSKEDLRTILAQNAIRLISLAVDDGADKWSGYFTWACLILDHLPMTADEQVMALGEAARFKPKRRGPHYLSVTRKLLKGKSVHVSFPNDRPSRPRPDFPLAS